MNIKNKNLLIGVILFLVGGLIGAAVATRYYGVGPIADLKGQESYAFACGPEWQAWHDASARNYKHPSPANQTYEDIARRTWEQCINGSLPLYPIPSLE